MCRTQKPSDRRRNVEHMSSPVYRDCSRLSATGLFLHPVLSLAFSSHTITNGVCLYDADPVMTISDSTGVSFSNLILEEVPTGTCVIEVRTYHAIQPTRVSREHKAGCLESVRLSPGKCLLAPSPAATPRKCRKIIDYFRFLRGFKLVRKHSSKTYSWRSTLRQRRPFTVCSFTLREGRKATQRTRIPATPPGLKINHYSV